MVVKGPTQKVVSLISERTLIKLISYILLNNTISAIVSNHARIAITQHIVHSLIHVEDDFWTSESICCPV